MRDKWGRFCKNGLSFKGKAKLAGSIFVVTFSIAGWNMIQDIYRESFLSYTAEAWELPSIVRCSAERDEAALVDIVWGGESGHYVPVEGETLPTFDPSQSMYKACIKIGGRHPKDCLSYGPFQEKIGTVQYYAPRLYGREVSEKEARDIAEGLESSRHFFVECSVTIKGCVTNWTTAMKDGKVKKKVQEAIDKIRACRGIQL